MNSPTNLIDPLGLYPQGPGKPPCPDCPVATVNLPTVEIVAYPSGSNRDQSPERYGFSGDWDQYKSYYNLKGWSYENYSSYYENTYRGSFDSYVESQDRNQAAKDALGKMWYFTFMMSTAGSMGVGTMAPSLSMPRGFNFVSPVKVNIPRLGGRLGSLSTRNQIAEIAIELESRGYTITNGGGLRNGIRLPEEYLKPLGGGRTGGSYLDLTGTHPRYGVLRINTVDTYKSGLPTLRELNNATRIRSQIAPGEHLLLIPKK